MNERMVNFLRGYIKKKYIVEILGIRYVNFHGLYILKTPHDTHLVDRYMVLLRKIFNNMFGIKLDESDIYYIMSEFETPFGEELINKIIGDVSSQIFISSQFKPVLNSFIGDTL